MIIATVLTGQTKSDALSLGNGIQGGVLTRIETPGTLDSITMTLEVSSDNGVNFTASTGAAITVAINKSIYIDPLYTRGGTHCKLVFGTSETTGGTARSIKCVVEFRKG